VHALNRRLHGTGLMGVEDWIELEAVHDLMLRSNLSGVEGPQEHRSGQPADKLSRGGDVLRPETLTVQVDLDVTQTNM
jgi:hypothetical protein